MTTTKKGPRFLHGLGLGLALALTIAAVTGPDAARSASPAATVHADAPAERPWSAEDEAGVRAAVEDYVLGVYEVAPERIERSVHPEMRKIGYFRRDGSYVESPMTFEQLVALAGSYNADGQLPDDAPQAIEILDVLDKTATAKLTAIWGIDYFHLVRADGRWMIMNVLWQSHPPEAGME